VSSRRLSRALALAVAALVAVPAVALATTPAMSLGDRMMTWLSGDDRPTGALAYATDAQGGLLAFYTDRPGEPILDAPITGLPAGVALAGIDFRPATGDLYGVGSDGVVYRVNPATAIAIAEGPPIATALRGTSFGVDFNPTVDKIRVTSDAGQNLRLDPDPSSLLAADPDLSPAGRRIVGSAYTASSFTVTRPATTTLYDIDAAADELVRQDPANAGTLVDPKRLRFDVTDQAGFDIGPQDRGYVVTNPRGCNALYAVDLATGRSTRLGRIADGRPLTGLAVLQDAA
jgi:uncharacterized protein DUF4394